jgi:hypothetical protein
MRLFAFAALLALPLLGLGAQSASADYYCCGKEKDEVEHKVGWTYVVKDSAIFDCDSHDCRTKIKIQGGTKVKVYCRNGWCHIKNFPFAHMWVLEECLKPFYREGEGEGDGEDNGEEGGEGDSGEGYKRNNYRKY